eukprot:3421519-Rhodomonas_salina.3
MSSLPATGHSHSSYKNPGTEFFDKNKKPGPFSWLKFRGPRSTRPPTASVSTPWRRPRFTGLTATSGRMSGDVFE